MEINIKSVVNELSTLRDMLRWSVTQFNQNNIFYGHGTDNSWDEALYIVLAALNLPPEINSTVLDARLLPEERKKIAELIQKRVTDRIPAAYLTKKAWFAGLAFYVDERVLVPRSPMAELIEKQFDPWIESHKIERILDLCTGSGCIGIACATYMPQAKVDITDISTDALEVAKTNIEQHKIGEWVRPIHSDLFNALPGQIYDVIISNPPYVGAEELAGLPHEYHHEPKLGLAAGEKGLDIVTRILREAHKHLSPEGILVVEVGNTEEALIEKFPEIPFTWLEFERGGGGVFLLTAEQLEKVHNIL